MAQLTWRNVDAPNFSGVTDALRLAGQSLQAGLSAGRDAIGDFQKAQTQGESARLMGAIAAEKDPAKLQQIIAGFDPMLLTPDAVKTALARPQDMATLDQTRASTASTQATTDFTRQTTPLRVKGLELDNQTKTLTNTQTAFTNENARKEYAAAGEWNAEVAQWRADRASSDPVAQARAATRAASPDFVAKATAAGVKDISGVLDKGETAAINAARLKSEYLALDEKQRTSQLAATSRSLAENLIAETGSPAGALRRIQEDANASPELRTAVADIITKAAPNYAKATEADVLTRNAAAAGTGQPGIIPTAPRERLDFFTKAAQDNGLVVTSGFRDEKDPLTKANPNSAHAKARAWDLRAKTPEEGDAVMAKQREIFTKLGMQEGRDYKILDEVRKPAGHATGPHIHVQLTAEGEDRQKTAQAGQNIGPGDRARQIMSSAVDQSAARMVEQARAAAAAASNFQPGVALDTPESILTEDKKINSTLSSISNTSIIDGAFNPAAPIAEAFGKPKESASTQAAVVNQLHKTLIADKDNGGITSRDKLPIGEINRAVEMIMQTHKVSPDIAGALVESAVRTTDAFIPLFGSGGRNINMKKVAEHVDRFVDKDGKPKTELLQIMSRKESIKKEIQALSEKGQQDREVWMGAEAAAKRGNTRVDVNAARQQMANSIRAREALARKLAGDLNVTANTRAITGR